MKLMKILIASLVMMMLVSTVSAECGLTAYERTVIEDIDFNQARPYTDTGIEYIDTITQSHGGIQVEDGLFDPIGRHGKPLDIESAFTPNQPNHNGGDIQGTEFVGSLVGMVSPDPYVTRPFA